MTNYDFLLFLGSRDHDHGIISGSFRDHFGIILGPSWDGFRTKCWSIFYFVFSHFRDMFGTCLGTLLKYVVQKQIKSQNRMKLCQIAFRLKMKLLMRSRGRSGVFCFLDFFRKVLLHYVRQPNVR